MPWVAHILSPGSSALPPTLSADVAPVRFWGWALVGVFPFPPAPPPLAMRFRFTGIVMCVLTMGGGGATGPPSGVYCRLVLLHPTPYFWSTPPRCCPHATAVAVVPGRLGLRSGPGSPCGSSGCGGCPSASAQRLSLRRSSPVGFPWFPRVSTALLLQCCGPGSLPWSGPLPSVVWLPPAAACGQYLRLPASCAPVHLGRACA